jgi:predicted dehydrogenase
MKPVKLGIIGCGIAPTDLHRPALKKLSHQFEIVSVCSQSEQKASDFSKMIGGVPFVTDYRKILENPEIEAVDISLPIHLNFQVAQEALEAGKHVFVEKPIAASLAEAETMLTFETKYPKVMMVAENFRYHPVFHRVRDYLDSGKIGKPYSVFWDSFFHLEPGNKYARTKWRINHKHPGGFITDGGVHNIAALRYMFGEIISGIAYTRSVNRALGQLDSISFLFTAQNCVNGVFNLYHSSIGYSESKLVILGSEGSIRVSDKTITLSRENEDTLEETVESDGGYRAEFEDFFQAVRTGKKVLSTFEEGYKDLKTIIHALESAKEFDKFKID